MKGNMFGVVLVLAAVAAAAYFLLRDAPQDATTTPTPLGTPVRTMTVPTITTPANQY